MTEDTPRHLRIASDTNNPARKSWRAKRPSDAEQLVCPKCGNSEAIETRSQRFIHKGKLSAGQRHVRCATPDCRELLWSYPVG